MRIPGHSLSALKSIEVSIATQSFFAIKKSDVRYKGERFGVSHLPVVQVSQGNGCIYYKALIV
ncbi:MAG: hypothetical protein ACR2PX_26995 [Endozoicomonas sp.]|uniref:hypothetical protein n=1 Tax=Endozoicomonas sp. TaxID=1892382 RepID=UPI003D9AE191